MKKEVNFYYVYIITNLISNKQYVGSKICYKNDPNNDGYMGSSKYLNKDYEIHGMRNFSKKILAYYNDKNSMLNGETEYILKFNALAPIGYNRFLPNTKPSFHMGGIKQSKESIEKRVNKLKGKKRTAKHKKNISLGHLGQVPWNKGKHTRSGENNGMHGKSVYNLWVEKFGIEEANKLKEQRKIKSSNSLKGKNKGKPKAYDVWVQKYGIEEANERKDELHEKLSNSLIGKKHAPSKFKNMHGKDSPVYKQIPENELTKIIELYEKGMGCKEISKFFNEKYTIYKIRRALKEDHVYVKRKNTPKRKL